LDTPSLTFEALEIGHRYADYELPVSPETIEAYCRALGSDVAVYRSGPEAERWFRGAIAPPTLPAMVTPPRVSFSGWRIPTGAVHVAQEWESLGPIRPGDRLRLQTLLADKTLIDGRQHVVLDTSVRAASGDHVARGRMTLLWPR